MGSSPSTISSAVDDDARQFSHFPSKDIHEWSLSFKSEFPDGYITLPQLELIFRDFFPFGSHSRFSRRLFETINISQSDIIDFHELLIAYSILMKGSDHEKLRWIFRFYDLDGDGAVSRAEMTEVIGYVHEMTSYTLDVVLDVSGIVDEIFECLGNDRDYLDFDDFKSLSMKNEKIFKLLMLFSE